ncbi:transglutaminase domain-containing protein [candidate division KSB1 bacterium]|nr:transglutaminase domain-containing protein [candidate division KSB1 bacterium]
MKKLIFLLVLNGFILSACQAENYLLNGGQESQFKYTLTQQVTPNTGIHTLYLSYVIPENFSSPTYNQRISNLNIQFSPDPYQKQESRDERGNKILKALWKQPRTPISTTISFIAGNKTLLNTLNSGAPFPPANMPAEAKPYLGATKQVPSTDARIRQKANELTRGAKTQFDAVQRILSWVIDHMNYVLIPPDYDAMYSFNTGKGNCQNYSHLAAALMRSVGIPVRIVNGVCLKEQFQIKSKQGTLTMKMAQGRHSWIEVYFPDLDWVPFDPQQTQLFVSNRFIRIEVGMDNNETDKDGLIRWTQTKGTSGKPQFQESIEAIVASDNVALSGEMQTYGPRKLLLTPAVKTAYVPYASTIEVPPPPVLVSADKLKRMRFIERYSFGNVEFPEGIDFLLTRGPATRDKKEVFAMKKNFLVETAEYVTSAEQYAQTFILRKPMKLQTISLALHKFGGDGILWLDLLEDKNGAPGNVIASSAWLPLTQLPFKPGYYWEDFAFSKETTVLSPGRYWIALGFNGSPIVNWFYSYGKPVGPQDGTRSKLIFDQAWKNVLAYEFNYKVNGLVEQ